MQSSDGKTRHLVSTLPGEAWDFGIARHPYFEFERPLGPHYTVYNRRLMACCFDQLNTEDGYWLLRQKAAVLHTGELPIEFRGPDAEALLDRLFTKDISKLRIGRCGYGIACDDDGKIIVDGILLRLAGDRFWYAQADGDFYHWAKAHARSLDVVIEDPRVFVSQVQGPNALDILASAGDDGMPSPFGYFACARVRIGGQDVVVSRTGYTNELGWEFYTEPHHDATALWTHLCKAGAPFGLAMHGLDSMNIRRIEAGILNAGSDFDCTTTPYDVGLGVFVDETKIDFIGKRALLSANKKSRLVGVSCDGGQPRLHSEIQSSNGTIGKVTAGAHSPFLQSGIGLALLDEPLGQADNRVEVLCVDGNRYPGKLIEPPFYDREAAIPRGKLVDIPTR